MKAKLGDKIRLYGSEGNLLSEVTITKRGTNGEVFYDTVDESGEYGNTYPTYKSIETMVESYELTWNVGLERIEIVARDIQEQWSNLLNGDTLWVTKYELDEILDNLKSLNINTLMIQCCKDKFVVKVDDKTVRKFKEA